MTERGWELQLRAWSGRSGRVQNGLKLPYSLHICSSVKLQTGTSVVEVYHSSYCKYLNELGLITFFQTIKCPRSSCLVDSKLLRLFWKKTSAHQMTQFGEIDPARPKTKDEEISPFLVSNSETLPIPQVAAMHPHPLLHYPPYNKHSTPSLQTWSLTSTMLAMPR